MTYQILTADSPGELKDKVNTELHKGWQLQGGVSVVPVGPKPYVMGNPYGEHKPGSRVLYAQAVTKE